jgi:N-sulfoglucosamine sulfohydrolase
MIDLRFSALLGTTAVLSLLAGVPAVAVAQQRPDIVLFIADDLGVGDIEPYGNEVVRTPTLQRLAAESLRFTRAFAASPTCSPSRSALYTGLYPFRNGAHANHTGVRPEARSLAHHLQPLGYRVALAGKLHVGPREQLPFELIAGSNVPEPGHEGDGVLFTDLALDPVDSWLAALPDDEPLLLVVADHSPHVVWPERAEYDPSEVDVPPTHIDTPELRAARTRYYTDVTKMDRNLGRVLEMVERHRSADNTLVVFTADQGPQWPFGKWGLYDAGIQAPLLVRWPGRVRPGATTPALVSLVDLLPTFVEAAGGSAPEGIDGRSLLPVLLGRATAHREMVFASHTGDGRMNRAPMRMLRTERYKYIRNLAPEILYTTHMDGERKEGYWESWREMSFRDPHAAAVLWRYHNRPEEELYDLDADPHEQHNLAGDPGHATRIQEFRTRLAEWRRAQSDAETGPEDLESPDRRVGVSPYIF